MKKLLFLLSIILFSAQVVISQKVDSIRVEQSGDFIKIRYKILNSTPGQIYRVKVLFSMDGGLNQEPKTISGDVGDYVVGGKPEYWVLWDVLKDVTEIKSVEFIVRAELVKDINTSTGGKNSELTTFWAKKGANIMLTSEFPGPRFGFRLGYLRSFGFTMQYVAGKTVVNDPGGNPAFSSYNPPKLSSTSIALTKRIVNKDEFQMHLLLGVKRSHIIFFTENQIQNPLQDQKVHGFEGGLIFNYKNLAFSTVFSHVDPGPVLQEHTNSIVVSPLNYLSMSVGIRF